VQTRAFIKNNSQQLIAAFLFLLAYTPIFIWMWGRWFARDTYYSHGILVPFVTLYFIWQKKDELEKIAKKRAPWSLVLFALGIALYLVSSILRIYFSSALSMLIVLVSLILYFYGTRTLRAIAFPIAFLLFMIPLPLYMIVNISFKMKLFAATIAAEILNLLGLYAVREGSVIKLHSTFVVVDDVCSGLRSLISLTALGSIFAYMIKAPLYKRLLLFLTTIPIAIITNVCRVVLLSVLSEAWGAGTVKGFVHDFTGFLVFALAFAMLYMIGRLLES
jgi:exosortase